MQDGLGIEVRALLFSPRSKYLGIGGMLGLEGERIAVWDVRTKKKVLDASGCGNKTMDLAFLNSEDSLVSSLNSTSCVSLWSIGGREKSVSHSELDVYFTFEFAI